MKALFKDHAGFFLIAVLFFVLGILRLNDLSLYTDCTRYLIWGNSVAHGNGFVDDTQPEPEYYIVNAPLFSGVLAPVLAIFLLSLTAAKTWTLLWGVLALLLFYMWMRSTISQAAAVAVVLFLALNPLTLVLSTEVLSEAPFLCAIMGVFILIDKTNFQPLARWQFIVLISILSVVILLREVGAALVGAAFMFFIFRRQWRNATYVGIGASVLFALWTYRNLGIVGVPETSQNPNLAFIFQHFVTSPHSTLLQEMIQRALINFNAYSLAFGGMVLYRFPLNLLSQPSQIFQAISAFMNTIQFYSFVIFLPMIVGGIIADFSRSKTALFRFLFLILYFGILIAYPVQDVRFLFVLLPFSLFYLALTITAIKSFLQLSLAQNRGILVALTLIFLLPNVVCLFEIVRTNIAYNRDPVHFSEQQGTPSLRSSYFSTPWNAMGAWISANIPPGAIIASPDKEIVPFAPRQKFLELNRAVPLPMFEAMLRDNAAEYLFAPTVFDNLIEYQAMINESKRFRFERISSVNRLNIYRISSRLENPQIDSTSFKTVLDLQNSSDLFAFGRLALKNEKYIEALAAFNKLQTRVPHLSDIVFQRFLTHAFLLDSAHAVQELREIYLSPTATSFIAPAQIHLHAMNSLHRTKSMDDSIARAEQLFNVSRLYWNLGYPRQAFHTVQQSVQTDPSFFVGLLWAWNYGMQIGDTAQAASYLSVLEEIDRENPVVKSFRIITLIQDTLRRASEHRKRSELRIALSREYHFIDLPDEALDEGQRAIGEDPNNKRAYDNLAELFTKRQKPLAVEKIRRQYEK